VKLRLCTIGVPRFMHEGLDVRGAWQEVDFAKAPKSARQVLVDFTGRTIQVHPDDVGELTKHGLEYFEQGGLRRLRPIPSTKK
jgi:hypothetical protein